MKSTMRKRLARLRKGQPTPGDVHIKAALTNISVAWLQSQDVYVADKVFPIVPVQHQSDQYWKFNKEDFFRDEAQRRAPASESAGGGFNVGQGTYSTIVEAYHKDIDDQTRANADSVMQLDKTATEFVTQKLMIRRERRWVANFFTTGVWATDTTPANLWSAAAGDPLADMEAASLVMQGNSGFRPNTLVLGPQTISGLRLNAKIKDQFKYTSSDSIDTAMLARYFNIDNVYVVNGIYSPSIEGTVSPTMQFMAGKHALLCYSAPSPSVLQPTAGYTFVWAGYTGSIAGWRIKKLRADLIASDRIEGEMAYDFRVISPELGYFFNGAVA